MRQSSVELDTSANMFMSSQGTGKKKQTDYTWTEEERRGRRKKTAQNPNEGSRYIPAEARTRSDSAHDRAWSNAHHGRWSSS